MVRFFSNKQVAFNFQVVRAFATSPERQRNGIFAEFSARVVTQLFDKDGKVVQEIPQLALNRLRIMSIDGQPPFVGSDKYTPLLNNPQTGRQYEGNPVYQVNLFPGHRDDDKATQVHDKFMDELIVEVQEFIKQARDNRAARESAPVEVPGMLKGLASLAPAEKPKQSQSGLDL